MPTHLFDSQYEQYKSVIDNIFKELHDLTLHIRQDKMASIVTEIRARLSEPFLFVIVGEVKVGKSSFVNALLETDKEVCKVAPDPCTDTIQQIVYGETENTLLISEHLRKLTLPIDILKKIAIVDTPGTNTVLEHHTEITEKFIPSSDLIIFVFEAKNPYRQSAWQFFDYVSKEWRKKVVFVLQQCDVMEPDDLEINKKGVIQYAIQRGLNDPKLFCVSAKLEQKGDTANSGFAEMRQFIRESVTGGNNMRLKIQSLINTSQHITDTIKQGLDERNRRMLDDTVFRNRVKTLLDHAETKSGEQVQSLVETVTDEYDKVTRNIRFEFEQGLGLFSLLKKSIWSIWDDKQSMKQWISDIAAKIEHTLKPALERKMRDGVVNISDSIRQMAEIIDLEVQKNKAASVHQNRQIFGDIADKRQEKLEALQQQLQRMLSEKESFVNTQALRQSEAIMPNITLGGSLAVIGAILAGVTHTVMLDVTGGILSVVGLTVAGIVTAFQRNKIVAQFDEQIAEGRSSLREQIDEKLKAYVREIKHKIDNNFFEFDAFVKEEQQQLADLQLRYEAIDQKFKQLSRELEL
ncbi:MAG: dynamin family protein [Chitinophagales bacterium]|jgi:predicted GTPase|nr:dynamin family protein [Chitinophagales bacterium]